MVEQLMMQLKQQQFLEPYHNEGDDGAGIVYRELDDLAQGTGFQHLAQELGNGNDESASGYLLFYDPANTTFVKHFIG